LYEKNLAAFRRGFHSGDASHRGPIEPFGLRHTRYHPYMPVTLSYDLKGASSDRRNYLRSMLERFGWKRLGGSVFRYSGRKSDGGLQEDWLNDIAPSLMFFRSYVRRHKLSLTRFTIDAQGVSFLDHSDKAAKVGRSILAGGKMALKTPTNPQSSEKTIRSFIDAAEEASSPVAKR